MDAGLLRQIIYTCIVYLNSLLIGITRGFPNLIHKHLSDSDIISEYDISWIACLCVLPNPIGSLIGGFLMDRFGRITTLKISTILTTVSWFVIAISTVKSFIYISFILIGIAVGIALISGVYVAEISSERYRGVLLSIFILFYTMGIFLATLVTYFLDWRSSSWTFIAMSLGIFILSFFLEESPMWYAKKRKRNEAVRAFQNIRQISQGEAEKEYENVLLGLQTIANTSEKQNQMKHLMSSGKPFFILAFFQICLQGSGFNLLLTYSSSLFSKVTLPIDDNKMAITYSIALLVSSFFAPFASLYGSRKKVVSVSAAGMSISLAVIFVSIFNNFPYALQIASYLYVFCAAAGAVTISECVPSELYRTEVRGFMCGITQAYNTIIQGILVKVFPLILMRTDVSYIIGTFTAFSIVMVFFGTHMLPETKGKTLVEIQQQYFDKKSSKGAEKCPENGDTSSNPPI